MLTAKADIINVLLSGTDERLAFASQAGSAGVIKTQGFKTHPPSPQSPGGGLFGFVASNARLVFLLSPWVFHFKLSATMMPGELFSLSVK